MKIGVFFGGKSPEHDVSIITGQLIISQLKKMSEFEVVAVYLDKNGHWFLGNELNELKFFSANDNNDKFKGMDRYYLDLEKSRDKMVFRKKGMTGREVAIDFAFPAFHGANGEDGTMQGLFEMFNIPYAGCDVASSALAMDKILTKTMYRAHNIATSNCLSFSKKDWQGNKAETLKKIGAELRYPLFIKPPKLGSSIGITRVTDAKELEFGIEVALHYGDQFLVENGVENMMDITCAVIGNNEPLVSLVQESSIDSDFFNYEEKYLNDGGAQTGNSDKNIFIPARLDEEVTKSVRDMAVEIYKIFNCSGMARIDFLFDKLEKKIYTNEINTMPGTLYHHLWKASGVETDDLIRKLVSFGIAKHKEKNSYSSDFKSDILKSLNSVKLNIK